VEETLIIMQRQSGVEMGEAGREGKKGRLMLWLYIRSNDGPGKIHRFEIVKQQFRGVCAEYVF
jgi:hypothetical protein